MTFLKYGYGSTQVRIALNTGTTVGGVYTPAIKPGDFLAYTAGSNYATKMATAKPVVGADLVWGISEEFSTETATVDGLVRVEPLLGRTINVLIDPTVTTLNDTQAHYDAIVGHRVFLNYNVALQQYTLLVSADSATGGFIVMEKNINYDTPYVALRLRAPAIWDEI